MATSTEQLLERMQEFTRQGHSFVVGTLLATRGHAPQNPGAKILITAEGLEFGTIGGGKLEARAIRDAQSMLADGSCGPVIVEWDLQKDVGMSCGGWVKLLFETYRESPWTIQVFGAGHVAQALCRALLPLSCRITCVDNRQEWVERLPKAPQLRSLLVDDMEHYAREVEPQSYCVVLTMGHSVDLPILKTLLARDDVVFVGSMGSQVKARLMRADLTRAGLNTQQVQALHCPIGIDFNSRVPEEIAVSICAQLLQVRYQLSRPNRRPALTED